MQPSVVATYNHRSSDHRTSVRRNRGDRIIDGYRERVRVASGVQSGPVRDEHALVLALADLRAAAEARGWDFASAATAAAEVLEM